MYSTYLVTIYALFICEMTDFRQRPNLLDMEHNLKSLNITNEDFTDKYDKHKYEIYLEKDKDLDYILGNDNDLNIIQLNIRGLINKQTSSKTQ